MNMKELEEEIIVLNNRTEGLMKSVARLATEVQKLREETGKND